MRAGLAAVGLEAYAEAIVALARPSVRLEAELAYESSIPVGASKLGGRPDLPAAIDWPEYEGLPQSFLAQLNLAELAGLEGVDALPRVGVLSFFYDAEQRPWGFNPAESSGWKVVYSPNPAQLQRVEPPAALPGSGRFGAAHLHARSEITYAPWEFSEIQALGLTFDQQLACGGVMGDVLGEPVPPLHRLLGHPDPIQGNMQLECQLASHGLNVGNSSGYDDPRAAALSQGATAWRLLLQLDTDDDIDMMWGDVGMLYFWIHKDDLAARAWERAWFALQCS